MASILIPPEIQFIDANGNPMVGAEIWTYAAGTNVAKASYQNYEGTILNINPVVLDAAGRAKVWISGAYKIIITVPDGDPLNPDDIVYSADNVISYTDIDFSGLTATIDDLNSTTTTGIHVTANYTVLFADRGKTVLVNASSTDVIVSLPPIVQVPNKWKICIKKVDQSENIVNITANGTELIENTINPFVLYDFGDFIEILADGSIWWIVASQQRGTMVSYSDDVTIDAAFQGKTVLANAYSGNFNIYLPTCASVGRGFIVTIKGWIGGNYATIIPNAGDTIDSVNGNLYAQSYNVYTLKVLDSATWAILNYKPSGNSNGWVTGDIKYSLAQGEQSRYEWVQVNGTNSIGSSASGANYTGDVYYNLYSYLYTYFKPSITIIGGDLGSVDANWNGNKQMRLPTWSCRVPVAAGTSSGLTSRTVASTGGEEHHVLTVSELAAHTHSYVNMQKSGGSQGTVSSSFLTGDITGSTGGSAAHENMPPFVVFVCFIHV